MDSSESIMLMIVICVGLMLFVLFSKPIKYVLKVLTQGALGFFGIYLLNFVTASMGISVGLNVLNFFITGVLGVPGLLLLYGLSIIL